MAARKAGEHANGNPPEHAHRPRKRGDQATQHEDGPESHGAPEAAEQRAEEPTNRMTEPAAAAADGQPVEDSTVNRAEEIVDQVAARVAQWTSSFGRTLLRFGARAREEAEDMWAEAQHIRHGGRS